MRNVKRIFILLIVALIVCAASFTRATLSAAVVKVPDPRLDALAPLFEPRKFTPAEVQYVDVAGIVRGAGQEPPSDSLALRPSIDVTEAP